jgi:glucose/arabinose dehydrogenase
MLTRRKRLGAITFLLLAGFILSAEWAASKQPTAPLDSHRLRLEEVVPAGGLNRPVDVAHAGDERLFVVELEGTIRVVYADGTVAPEPFLDISDQVALEGEQGLLGLVFHPDYENNGIFYVNYTALPDGDTHVSRFNVTGDPDVADEGTEVVILSIEQPHTTHNAGDLAFGPQDGYLYVPTGDGGSAHDPWNNAQDAGVLLGKILRIDVDMNAAGSPDCGAPGLYTVPQDNPFVDGAGGACDEIWALGLRNPWRISFDRLTGDLYIGDVGQSAWEEVNFQPAASTGGQNYGWSCLEGAHVNEDTHVESCEAPEAYEMPVYEYAHTRGATCTAVTGGFVYRGSQYPELSGRYFFADLCSGLVWDLDPEADWQVTLHGNMSAQLVPVATFGEGVDGELYLANTDSGALYHLAAQSPFPVSDRAYLPVAPRPGVE